jgi:phosphoserine phosphatase
MGGDGGMTAGTAGTAWGRGGEGKGRGGRIRAMKRELQRVSLVVFDCDSTLSAIEGIDELGAGMRAEIGALTDAAMRGEVPLEAVYGRRLEMIRPTRGQLEELARQYVAALVPDAAAVVRALRAEGVAVRVMSGGLLPAVRAVAEELGLSGDDVAAVDIRFDEAGGYAGFDAASPLARSGGKRDVMQQWRAGMEGAVMLVGDGATDLEARDDVDLFVAYAGVVERAAVVAGADVVIRSPSLAPVLPLALAGAAPRAESRTLYERGVDLLGKEYHSLITLQPSREQSDQ